MSYYSFNYQFQDESSILFNNLDYTFEIDLNMYYISREFETNYGLKEEKYYPEISVQTAEIDKLGIKNINNLTEVQTKVYKYYKNKYISTEALSKSINNLHINMKIEIWKRGIHETFGNQRYYKYLSKQEKKIKLATMDSLAKIIKHSRPRASEALNKHNINSPVRYYYLKHPMTIDGTRYMIYIDIRKAPKLNGKFYIHSVQMKKVRASKSLKASRSTALTSNKINVS